MIGKRLEEIVYTTAREALRDAQIDRSELESVTLGASDELDGRPISSMLLTAPAGGMLTDEMKVTDSGLTALCLGAARIMTGEFETGLVASWCKPSKTTVGDVMRFRADPFYMRPLGIDADVADAMWSQASARRHSLDSAEVAARVASAQQRASVNPRGLMAAARSASSIRSSAFDAPPIRSGHRAPYSDGAAALVLASQEYVDRHGLTPLARLTGFGWNSDEYTLGAERLSSTRAFDRAWDSALQRAGLKSASELDLIEFEAPTGYHEATFVRDLELPDHFAVSPSGGVWAQNPLFCTGLVNAVEAVLQVSGRAGPTQVEGASRAAAHSVHGFAAQGHVVTIFEGAAS